MLHPHSSAPMAGCSPCALTTQAVCTAQKPRDKHSLSKALRCLCFGSSGYISACTEVSGSPTSHSRDYLTLNVSLGCQLWEQQHSQLDCAHLPTLLTLSHLYQGFTEPHIPLTRAEGTFNWHRKQLSLGLCLTP